MGDPRRFRKQYTPPRHPWIRSAIEQGKELRKEFGFRGRKDILIASSYLKKYKDLAKKLIATKTTQSEKVTQQIMTKLQSIGLLQAGAQLEDILSLQLKDVLNRRLQSIVYHKGLARSMKQARQFITHRHVMLGDKEITSPGFIVSLEQEAHLRFKPRSGLVAEDHPERVAIVRTPAQEAAAAKRKAARESREEEGRKRGRDGGRRRPRQGQRREGRA